jgi:hypothetical protein
MEKLADKPIIAIIGGLISIIAAILPIIFSNIFKKVERKSALFINKTKIEEASRRMDFLDKYILVQAKMLGETELTSLKKAVSTDLIALKQSIDLVVAKTETAHDKKVLTVQTLLLTFRPTTATGWALAFLFYLWLMIMAFFLLGAFAVGFKQSIHDGFTITAGIILLMIGVLIRYQALRVYKKHPPVPPSPLHAPPPMA